MIDPFLPDPEFAPRPDSVECALVQNHRDFVRETQRATPKHQRPNLPQGVYLQLQADGGWALFFPDRGYGYRRVNGSYEELLALAQTLTTET